FFRAAEDGFEMLPTNKPIYVLGESLGSGVACYLAGCHPDRIAGLILISPYDRLTSVAHFEYPWLPVGLLMVDRFPSADYLRRYHGNIGVSVDGRDAVIPEKIGLRLYHGYAGPKKLWEFPDGGHCQIRGPQSMFWKEAFDFLDSR
ncbi:MAG TPA: alpha/beta fold hydrolase, partial [Verrucomicrobiae bacterium]|nr:alpha/beta fold hydrolase [Verrucomicrobiae bacterium]